MSSDGDILGWAFNNGQFDPDWVVGGGFFVLGLFGALITAYLFLGEFLPAMGGRAGYLKREAEIGLFKKRLEDTVRRREQYVAGEPGAPTDAQLAATERLGTELQAMIHEYERGQSRQFWRLAAVGFPMYVLLGGLTAALLATSLLQALIIGFAWPAIVDRIGLGKQMAVTKELKNEEIDNLQRKAEALVRDLAASRQRESKTEASLTRLAARYQAKVVPAGAAEEKNR
ncbi:MAG TPA: hypothetical protein VES62_07375 [Thermoleophilaceae bacterium]|nr:hypothetical protein [Thermoleophilaceae bacterium]